jgi:predicted transcriptional regulator of viral defense system
MNLYFELMQIPVFTMEDVCKYYDKIESARSAVKRLIKQGTVVKIRNNMYTCISGETGAPIANRFQIASCITPTSYVSHHTAMEYYGVADQVYYDVYVSSETKFQTFDFYGYTYQCVLSKCKQGIETVRYSGSVKVTDKERTLVDCLKDMDKISGLEETMANVQGLHNIQEKKILQYLEEYSNQFLYQKMGFLLWNIRTQLGLSDTFFEVCMKKIGKSKRYLTKDASDVVYDNVWKIVAPKNITHIKNGEDIIND